MSIIATTKQEETAHFYKPDGKPCHGNLRQARKANAYPSVTTIIGQAVNKSALTNWLIEQGILASLTLPRLPDESPDAFARRVVGDAESISSDAMELGTRVHGIAEEIAKGHVTNIPEDLKEYHNQIVSWFKGNITKVVWTEKVLVGKGYAGTADLLAIHRSYGLSLIDFKTQSIKEGNEARFYRESWPLQLAAYRTCLSLGEPLACVNVVIPVNPSGLLVEKVWTGAELDEAMTAFNAAYVLWKYIKKYDPLKS